MDLGVAFQLANFIRDVGEDLDRGRLYLPLADLAQFGLTREDLERRVVTPPVRELLKFEIAAGATARAGVPPRRRAALARQPALHRRRPGSLLRNR